MREPDGANRPCLWKRKKKKKCRGRGPFIDKNGWFTKQLPVEGLNSICLDFRGFKEHKKVHPNLHF